VTKTSYPKAFISVLLTMAIATVFTIRSFASPDLGKVEESTKVGAQDCTGTLTVIAGRVTINGNAAQTGATVLTGSAISTDSKGKATIDLGAAGRVELGESTSVTLICVGSSIEIRSNCSKTEVEVRRGTLEVKTPKAETLVAGKEHTYDGAFDASSAGGIDVKIECEGRKGAGGLYVGPGLLGLLALAGIGGAIAAGIAAGGNEGAAEPSSPIQ
jgi:hypothetical protein